MSMVLLLLLLLLLKLLVDIVKLKLTRNVFQHRLPPELWLHMEQSVVRSDISRQWAGKPYRDLTAVQQKLEDQIKSIVKSIQEGE